MPTDVFLVKLATFFLQPIHASIAIVVSPTVRSVLSRHALNASMAFSSTLALVLFVTVH